MKQKEHWEKSDDSSAHYGKDKRKNKRRPKNEKDYLEDLKIVFIKNGLHVGSINEKLHALSASAPATVEVKSIATKAGYGESISASSTGGASLCDKFQKMNVMNN